MKTPKYSESGATMLQFAMVLPLLLMLVIGIIDIARYQMTKGLLNAAAADALVAARIRTNLDIVTDRMSPGDYDRWLYIDAANKVEAAATNLLENSPIGPVGSSGGIHLEGFRHFDDEGLGSVAILRLYECAKVGASPVGCKADDQNCVRHPAVDLHPNLTLKGKVFALKNDPRVKPYPLRARGRHRSDKRGISECHSTMVFSREGVDPRDIAAH